MSLLDPECFGAVGDGITDDTQALQDWASWLGAGVNGRLDGSYLLNGAVTIQDKADFTISGSGRIKIADGAGVTELHSAFIFFRCQRWRLEGVRVDGNRDNRQPAEASGHLIRMGESSDFEVRGVRADNGTTDGFYVFSQSPEDPATHCRRFKLINCHADNNYRQGMSIIQGHDFEIIGGAYTGTNGTAPEAGIDLESNAQDALNSITNGALRGVRFEGNAGYGLLVSQQNRPLDISAIDCTFHENIKGAIRWGALTGSIVNPLLDGVSVLPERGMIDIPSGSFPREGHVSIETPRYRNIQVLNKNHPFLYEHSAANAVTHIVGMDDGGQGGVVQLNGDGSSFRNPVPIKSAGLLLFYMSGDDQVIEGVRGTAFTGALFKVSGDNCLIRDISLLDPVSNSEFGMILIEGSGATVENVSLVSSSAADLYGLRMESTAKVVRAVSCEGFLDSAKAFHFIGSAATDTEVYRSELMFNGSRFFFGQSAISSDLDELISQLRDLGVIP